MKTKIIAVWHVEYVCNGIPAAGLRESHEEAVALRDYLKGSVRCLTITGPHQHRVPA